jgi:NitT/TauT family transport system substrate-binding protein
MERPADRVTYGDLRLIRSEFDSLMQLSLEAKMFPNPISYDTYIDESFMRAYRPVDIPIK